MSHGPLPPGAPDDELGRALSAGLSRATGGGVDTDALVAGARAGARRIRRRRTAVRGTVAALCAAAVLPLGVNLFGGSVTPASDTAAAGAAAPEAASAAANGPETVLGATEDGGAGGSAPVPTGPRLSRAATDQGSPASAPKGLVLRDGAGAVLVPDDAVLAADDLGTAPVTLAEDVPTSDAPTTVVALCGGDTPGDDAVAGGRLVRWDGPQVDGRAWSFSTVVRVFTGDGAAAQVAALRRSVGTCPESAGASRAPVGDLPGDEALLAVLPDDGSGDVRTVGVVRLGRTTAGVLLVVPATVGTDDAARRALAVERTRTLVERAAERLTPFAATADADPALG